MKVSSKGPLKRDTNRTALIQIFTKTETGRRLQTGYQREISKKN
jgi:hypothetical protein